MFPTAEWCFFFQFVTRDTRIATLQALVPIHATFGQTAVSDFLCKYIRMIIKRPVAILK